MEEKKVEGLILTLADLLQALLLLQEAPFQVAASPTALLTTLVVVPTPLVP